MRYLLRDIWFMFFARNGQPRLEHPRADSERGGIAEIGGQAMTREEAIECLKTIQRWTPDWDDREDGLSYWDAIDMALSALRPVSREQVEKMWTGCEKCRDQANWPSWIEKGFVYCPKCGTPLTSWAWEKQVERLEALNDAVD